MREGQKAGFATNLRLFGTAPEGLHRNCPEGEWFSLHPERRPESASI